MNCQIIKPITAIVIIGTFLSLSSCQTSSSDKTIMTHPDKHTFAKPDALITHLDWVATVDFENKRITGIASFIIKTGRCRGYYQQ